ncbi:MAG: hypothetical protein K2X01_00300 [Cyanobacteria bacterium]|nr:hypothetical protein [Cyanobacteriota bacterium]
MKNKRLIAMLMIALSAFNTTFQAVNMLGQDMDEYLDTRVADGGQVPQEINTQVTKFVYFTSQNPWPPPKPRECITTT